MIKKTHFGTMPDGDSVECYQLINNNQVSVSILTLGGILQSWKTPGDSSVDIVLGFDTVEAYLQDAGYIGTVVGRYANRIAGGTFNLGDKSYPLSKNHENNTLHGGADGFHHRLWQLESLSEQENPSIVLSIFSPDGDQGFPGNLQASVEYRLTEDNCLQITYRADCDSDTVFNPTQHSYFNLAGHDSGSALEHEVQVNADHYTPADAESIPSGELRAVSGTSFDLSKAKSVAEVMALNDPEINATNGLDHNWCLNDYADNQQNHRLVATMLEPKSGRTLSVYTTMPGMQVYGGNFIGEGTPGKGEAVYAPHHGLCLETQYYPDSPNKEMFPSSTLDKHHQFVSRTDYQLSL